MKLCKHGANPKTCPHPTCYQAAARFPRVGQPAKQARVVHFTCGCRMAVSGEGEAGNWQECGDEGAHEGMPRVAGFFYEAAKKRELVSEEHPLHQREDCQHESCNRAAAAVNRVRARRQAAGGER